MCTATTRSSTFVPSEHPHSCRRWQQNACFRALSPSRPLTGSECHDASRSGITLRAFSPPRGLQPAFYFRGLKPIH
eukprot:8363179-Alexandrium_andersonii.AAC.1